MFSLRLECPRPGAARLRLVGHLDDVAAREVLHAAATAVACGCRSLHVDLDELTAYDEGTAYALVGCCRLARWLPDGVEVLSGGGAGAALAAAAQVTPGVRTRAATEGIMASCPAS